MKDRYWLCRVSGDPPRLHDINRSDDLELLRSFVAAAVHRGEMLEDEYGEPLDPRHLCVIAPLSGGTMLVDPVKWP